MDILKFKELIADGGYVFNCTTPNEAHELSKIIKHLYPGNEKEFAQLGKNAGTPLYPSGIAFRVELPEGIFDWGFSDPEWYASEDYTVINFSEFIHPDLGEFQANIVDIHNLLFGG